MGIASVSAERGSRITGQIRIANFQLKCCKVVFPCTDDSDCSDSESCSDGRCKAYKEFTTNFNPPNTDLLWLGKCKPDIDLGTLVRVGGPDECSASCKKSEKSHYQYCQKDEETSGTCTCLANALSNST